MEGLIAAFEIMIATPAIQNLIRESKTYRIPSSIQTGRKLGMVLLDDSLFDLFIQKKISEEELLAKAQLVGEMRERIDEFNNAQKQMGK